MLGYAARSGVRVSFDRETKKHSPSIMFRSLARSEPTSNLEDLSASGWNGLPGAPSDSNFLAASLSGAVAALPSLGGNLRVPDAASLSLIAEFKPEGDFLEPSVCSVDNVSPKICHEIADGSSEQSAVPAAIKSNIDAKRIACVQCGRKDVTFGKNQRKKYGNRARCRRCTQADKSAPDGLDAVGALPSSRKGIPKSRCRAKMQGEPNADSLVSLSSTASTTEWQVQGRGKRRGTFARGSSTGKRSSITSGPSFNNNKSRSRKLESRSSSRDQTPAPARARAKRDSSTSGSKKAWSTPAVAPRPRTSSSEPRAPQKHATDDPGTPGNFIEPGTSASASADIADFGADQERQQQRHCHLELQSKNSDSATVPSLSDSTDDEQEPASRLAFFRTLTGKDELPCWPPMRDFMPGASSRREGVSADAASLPATGDDSSSGTMGMAAMGLGIGIGMDLGEDSDEAAEQNGRLRTFSFGDYDADVVDDEDWGATMARKAESERRRRETGPSSQEAPRPSVSKSGSVSIRFAASPDIGSRSVGSALIAHESAAFVVRDCLDRGDPHQAIIETRRSISALKEVLGKVVDSTGALQRAVAKATEDLRLLEEKNPQAAPLSVPSPGDGVEDFWGRSVDINSFDDHEDAVPDPIDNGAVGHQTSSCVVEAVLGQ